MTVSTQIIESPEYTGDGVITELPFNFYFHEDGDVQVWEYVDGAFALSSLPFTVRDDEDESGAVILVDPLASGLVVKVVRSTQLTQEEAVSTHSRFYPRVLERSYDKLMAIVQEIIYGADGLVGGGAIGLPSVVTLLEAEEGTSTSVRSWSPLRVHQAISSLKGVTVYSSAAAVRAITQNPPPDVILVKSLDGGIFFWDSSDSFAENGGSYCGTRTKVTSILAGRYIQNNKRIVDFKSFGGGQTDVNDASIEMQKWVNVINEAAEGVEGYINDYVSLGSTINIHLARNVKIKAGGQCYVTHLASLTDPALSVKNALYPHTYRFNWIGGYLSSNKSITESIGGQFGTCFELESLGAGSSISSVTLYAGPDYRDYDINGDPWVSGTKYMKGDVGIGYVDCRNLLIDNCTFQGFPDTGVYGNGDGTAGTVDEGFAKIQNCRFELCRTGVVSKREERGINVIGNIFYKCSNGFQTAEVTDSGGIGAGQACKVVRNTFELCLTPIQAKMTNDGMYKDNDIIDYGYDPLTGALYGGANISAINLLGSKDNDLSGNTIRFVNKTAHSAAFGVWLQEYTSVVDGLTYSSGNNIHHNNINDMHKGIHENSVNDGPNIVEDNNYVNCTENFNRQHATSGMQGWSSHVVDFGTVVAQTSSKQTVTVPRSRYGDMLIVMPMTTGSSTTKYSARSESGDNLIEIKCHNYGVSNQTVNGALLRVLIFNVTS